MGDSNSIINQRHYLEKYAQDNGFENALFLYDDGYSGTNFDRPSWKTIIEMIEAGEVETLIVKDLSRLGREYLQVGYYTEMYFPEKGVRFIAVNDNVDSLVESSNDFNPIRNWANELHAKDTSKKVRSIKRMQAERGERLGGKPPYGYKKVSPNSKDIIPDEETAPVVLHIFELCASGKGPRQIATILKKAQVLTPSHYYYRKYGKADPRIDMDRPYGWSSNSVAKILDNIVYLGHYRALKATTVSFKNKTRVENSESEQVFIKNTHPAIITQQLWDITRDVRAHKRRRPKHMDEPDIFSGLVYCIDCHKPLVLFRSESMKKSQYHYKCYTNNKIGKEYCTPHQIRESDLTAVVLDDLRRVTHFARTKERQFADYINKKNSKEIRAEINTLQRELDTMSRRRDELMNLFKRLYEDNVLGRVTNEQFRMLSADYNEEQRQLDEKIPDKQARLEKLRSSACDVEAFIEKAKQFQEIKELTPELLRLFIQKIEVGERAKKWARGAPQDILIYYRDIGLLDKKAEKGEQPVHMTALPQTKDEMMKLLA